MTIIPDACICSIMAETCFSVSFRVARFFIVDISVLIFRGLEFPRDLRLSITAEKASLVKIAFGSFVTRVACDGALVFGFWILLAPLGHLN